MSAACQKDTVLPRVSSAVGRPVCVCETYLHPLHRENVYSLRLASRHWPRHHHSPSGQDALRTDRGTRTAPHGRGSARPWAWRRRRGPSAAGSWSRVGRCAPLPRNGTGSYRISPEIVAKRASGRTRQARMSARARTLPTSRLVAFYPDSVAQELCPPHVVAFYPDSVASDGVLYRVDRTTTHRSRGAVSRRHRPSLRRGAGPLRRPHFGSFDSLKT